MRALTLGVKLSPVLLEASQTNALAQQVQELLEGGSSVLVVVHIFLRALAGPAIHHPHLPLEIQLEGGREAVLIHHCGGSAL